METFWEPNGHAPHPVKYESEAAVAGFPYCTESSLNFSTSGAPYSEDDAEYSAGRRNKTSRDPLSHRIIEKRRRDRMNSCLADLSRLIPPQYQRKGRGRIEKTEIIEMAIRHLKHLQSECVHKEYEYKLGYADCMKEAAKFLYESHMQECCYRLIAHLDEIMKSDCFKSRCNIETTSASSGSPAQNNLHHTNLSVPTPQLRDILTSDVEHSNDHSDIKDLSFRSHHSDLHDNDHRTSNSNSNNNNINNNNNNNNNSNTNNNNNNNIINNNQHSHLAPVITSTGPPSIHQDDFDSSRELPHHENGLSSPPPISSSINIPNVSLITSNNNNNNHNNQITASIIQHHHHHLQHQQQHNQQQHSTDGILKSVRLRNLSESSHDIEHNNNYKYKNHIKERFNQDSHLNHHDESTSDHSITISESPINNQLQISNHNSNDMKPQLTIQQQNIKPELQDVSNNMLYKKRKLDMNNIQEHQKEIIDATLSSRNNNIQKQEHHNNQNQNQNHNLTEDIKIEISQLNSTKLINGNCGNGTIGTQQQTPTRHLNNLTQDRHFSVPIFALHGQGTYYVPLNIDYESLLPYLNGIDLFDKNYCPLPMLHPVNIHVNFSFPNAIAAATAAVVNSSGLTKSTTNSILPQHLLNRSKIESISNGW